MGRRLCRDAEEGVGGVFEEPDRDEVVHVDLFGSGGTIGWQVDGEVAFRPSARAAVGALDEDLGGLAEEPTSEFAL